MSEFPETSFLVSLSYQTMDRLRKEASIREIGALTHEVEGMNRAVGSKYLIVIRVSNRNKSLID